MKLHFESEGDGPAVVLLHGFPQYRAAWRRQLPALASAGFSAIAPDLRGYGASPKPPEVSAYAVPEIAADVAELIADHNLSPCVLVGHDWGAAVAWWLASTRPELLRKLIILSVPHPSAIKREVRRSHKQKLLLTYQLFFQLPWLPEIVMRLLVRRILRGGGKFTDRELDDFTLQTRENAKTMLHYYRALARSPRLGSKPAAIQTPTLFIWGEREPVFLPTTLDGMEQWVPDLRIERIPRAGHFVQVDATDRVNQLIIDFAR